MAVQSKRKKVLFICTHNSARSQMAEGLLRAIYGDRYEAFSAGTQPTHLHPLAARVMEEIGIDISRQTAKEALQFMGTEIDLVVTVCDQAKESCPFFPYGRKFLHQSFPDPAAFEGEESQKVDDFRRVRDEIRRWIEDQFGQNS